MAATLIVVLALVALCTGSSIRLNTAQFYPDYSRIVGGEQAEDNYAPFAVSLRSGLIIRSHFCGGSLITPRTIVTAAHCLDGQSISISLGRVVVNKGSNHISSGGVSTRITGALLHPSWNSNRIKSDFALAFTTDEIALNERVALAQLRPQPIVGGEPLVFVGWGRTVAGGPVATNLKKLYTTALSHLECVALRDSINHQFPGGLPDISESEEVCVFVGVGDGACHGDSGSPLLIPGTNQQVGVVSWGLPCAVGGPDVFARVTNYLDWANANARD